MSRESFRGRQFGPDAFEVRDFDGVPHQFVGWHLSSQQTLTPDPKHQHREDSLGLGEKGGMYSTFDIGGWSHLRPGSTAHEVWRRLDDAQDPDYTAEDYGYSGNKLLVNGEYKTPHKKVRMGQSMPVSEAARRSPVRYTDKAVTWNSEGWDGSRITETFPADQQSYDPEVHPGLPEDTESVRSSMSLESLLMGPRAARKKPRKAVK